MTVRFADIMGIPELRCFKLVAGEKGLDNVVHCVSYFDHKDDILGNNYLTPNYDLPGDLYLSNLSNSYQNEEDLLNLFHHLIFTESSGLIIDNFYLKELPEAAIALCNSNAFPVLLQQQEQISYSLIIYAIMRYILLRKEEKLIELKITNLLCMESPSITVASEARMVFPYISEHYLAISFFSNQEFSFYHKIVSNEKWFLCRYQNTFLLILSGTTKKELHGYLDYILSHLNRQQARYGISSEYDNLQFMNLCIKEAISAYNMCESLGKNSIYYNDLRTYSFLLPLKDNIYIRKYHKSMLEQIKAYDKQYGTDYCHTLNTFVDYSGSFRDTAEALFIHENSVRYRIDRIRKEFFPNLNPMDFYSDISVAFRIERILTNCNL